MFIAKKLMELEVVGKFVYLYIYKIIPCFLIVFWINFDNRFLEDNGLYCKIMRMEPIVPSKSQQKLVGDGTPPNSKVPGSDMSWAYPSKQDGLSGRMAPTHVGTFQTLGLCKIN
jgi:hypothetical protein